MRHAGGPGLAHKLYSWGRFGVRFNGTAWESGMDQEDSNDDLTQAVSFALEEMMCRCHITFRLHCTSQLHTSKIASIYSCKIKIHIQNQADLERVTFWFNFQQGGSFAKILMQVGEYRKHIQKCLQVYNRTILHSLKHEDPPLVWYWSLLQ